MPLDMAKYLALFVSEAGDHLAKLGADLVRLESAARGGGDTQAIVDELFRHAHSVKGMAASMQLEGIAALAHRAEDLVDVFRRRAASPDARSVDVLLAAVDALTAMVERAARGESPQADADLVERLGSAATPESGPRPPAPGPPASTPQAPRRIAVAVDVASACAVPSVRAFLVVNKLARLGAIVGSSPPVQDLKAGRLPGRKLEVTLDTGASVAEIEKLLAQISDLEARAVREEEPGPSPAAAAPGREERAREGGRTVRVKVELLDSFLDAVGELILATARLREIGRSVPEPFRPA